MSTWKKSTHSGGANTDCVEVLAGERDEIEQA